MTAPIGPDKSSPVDFFSMRQLTRLADILEGKEEQAPGDTVKLGGDKSKDVIIMKSPVKGGGNVSEMKIADELKEKGVYIKEKLPDIGVTGKLKDTEIENLKKEGYLIFDNSQRELLPGMPRKLTKVGNPWDMPKIDPVKILEADYVHDKGFTGKGQVVAVVDSGFNNPGVDLVAWKDVVDNSPSPIDPNGHGTHVAGDVKNIAPDAKIVAVRVMNEQGQGRTSDIIKGIQWVIENKDKHNIGVINLSLGSGPDGYPDSMSPLNKAVASAIGKGITVVAAAGNSGPKGRTIGSPADSPRGITVGSVLDDHKVSDFSSRGPTDDGLTKPDIMAPGEYIVSWGAPGSSLERTARVVENIRKMNDQQTIQLLKDKPQLIDALNLPKDILSRPPDERQKLVKMALPPIYMPDDKHIAAPGTSFSAPEISGLIADLRQAAPDATPDKIKEVLMKTADDVGPKYGAMDEGKGVADGREALDVLTAKETGAGQS
ncbi:MAG: S8 family serine peptidase [Chloroflexi bacterium]|nr:S8 family serine peptidase [Chloroflexota bacterium]